MLDFDELQEFPEISSWATKSDFICDLIGTQNCQNKPCMNHDCKVVTLATGLYQQQPQEQKQHFEYGVHGHDVQRRLQQRPPLELRHHLDQHIDLQITSVMDYWSLTWGLSSEALYL